MIGLAIKIALGLAACGLSVLGAADLKVAFEKASEQGRRWWACITAWEASKILFALAALVLFVTNEAVTYASQKDSSEQATRQTDQLNKRLALADEKLEQARSALGWSISALRAIKAQNYLLLSATDHLVQRVGVSRVMSDEISGLNVTLLDQSGSMVRPKHGDTVEWTFVCRNGAFPLELLTQEKDFSAMGFGRLIADQFAITLRSQTGREIFFGTRSTGQELHYEAGVLGSQQSRAAFKEAKCELDLSLFREAKWAPTAETRKALKSILLRAVGVTNPSTVRIVRQSS